MNQKIKEIIGCLISIGLLAVYAAVLWEVLNLVKEWEVNDPEIPINAGKLLILTGVGGLVSTIVIATLGISERSTAPTGSVRALSRDLNKTLMAIVTSAYVLVWLSLGGYLVYYGLVESPGASSTINELGQAWLGLAIGAVYAYVGINPKKPEEG